MGVYGRVSTVSAVLVFMFGFALTTASADPVSVCIKTGGNKPSGKINRGALGTTPAKGGCKNKFTHVILADENNVQDVQDEVDDLDGQINDPDGIADMVDMNKTDISTNTTAIDNLQTKVDAIVTSSMVGGDLDFLDEIGPGSQTAFMAMFGSNLVETEDSVTQHMAAPGILTNLFVRAMNAPGDNNTVTVTVRRPASGDTALTCSFTGTENSCNVTACAQFGEGDLIVLRMNYVQNGDDTIVFDLRWTSRFVENGVCP